MLITAHPDLPEPMAHCMENVMKIALSLFLFAALALASLGHSSGHEQAMAACQQLHSFDTCFNTLN